MMPYASACLAYSGHQVQLRENLHISNILCFLRMILNRVSVTGHRKQNPKLSGCYQVYETLVYHKKLFFAQYASLERVDPQMSLLDLRKSKSYFQSGMNIFFSL